MSERNRTYSLFNMDKIDFVDTQRHSEVADSRRDALPDVPLTSLSCDVRR